LQSEYFVPYDRAVPALRALYALREQIAPHLLISEVRAIAADSLWMSPCYQQACLSVHFTWKKDWKSVQRVLPQIEAQLASFQAKPHWGKLFTMDAATLASRYPKLPDFRRLRSAFDPQGKFRNAFLERCLSLD
jgi:xylitol oxidase